MHFTETDFYLMLGVVGIIGLTAVMFTVYAAKLIYKKLKEDNDDTDRTE